MTPARPGRAARSSPSGTSPARRGRRGSASPTTCSHERPRRRSSSPPRARASASGSRRCEAGGRVPQEPRPRGARARDRRGRGRVAARASCAATGASPTRRRPTLAGPLRGALPRQAVQLRLPRLPRPRGPARALRRCSRPEEIGVDAHRGRHDGPGGVRLGARLPPPGRALLRRLRRRSTACSSR